PNSSRYIWPDFLQYLCERQNKLKKNKTEDTMKTRIHSQSGVFNPRILVAFAFGSVGVLLALKSNAAAPASSMPLAPTGPAWSIVASPNTSTGEWNFLKSVTCTSASDCWAVGYYRNSGVDQICPGCIAGTLIEHWNGTVWSIANSPNTSATQLNYLN